MMSDQNLYRKMLMIRRFEEIILDLFNKGKIRGTTHTYTGQEANAVSLSQYLNEKDILVSHHRSHGHFLAHFEDPYLLFAEILGKKTGVSGGRGGSQHLCYKNFFSNGILGGMSATAAGMALAEKKKGTDSIVVFFATDGMLGEGILYEVLNMTSLWKLPLLIVLENNRYAQSTPIYLGVSGNIADRGKAFGLNTSEIESFDVRELTSFFKDIVPEVRKSSPHFAVIHTYRYGPHSKGDDYRDQNEIQSYRAKDPIALLGKLISENEIKKIQEEVEHILGNALEKALSDPLPTLGSDPVNIELFKETIDYESY